MILIFSGIFILGLVVVGSADDSSREDTITPVSMRDHTYAKPTTVHKRINVQRIVENVQISTVDPFTPSVPDARRQGTSKYTDLWSWDLWCHLQPKIGHCTESTILYYYDTQLDACISFTYSGCGGNQNSFNSVDDCQRHCKGAAYVIVKEPAASDSCELQPSAGLCMALIPKYYYDVNSRTCKEFSYGGCGGNQNRYDSKAECETLCHIMPSHPFEKDASKDTDLWNWDLWCHLQPKYGSCNANTTQYYYDTQLDACYTFTFSGCGGNKNNFYSEAECLRYCKGVSYVNLKESAVSDSCVLQPSAGPCTAYVTKYYYYINSETCKEFSYGGCGGNQNRYERKDACETECPKSPGGSKYSDFWSWDLWCHLQKKVGICSEYTIFNMSHVPPARRPRPRRDFSHAAGTAADQHGRRADFEKRDLILERYYYDTHLDTCVSFNYSGCGGNQNNFYSSHECLRHCNGAAFVKIKESVSSDLCQLQPSAGPCTAYITKYYYDVNSRTCKEFSYGGCGGNQNRYGIKAACETECQDRRLFNER